MKIVCLFAFAVVCYTATAQKSLHLSAPKTNWKSYNFKKQIDNIKSVFYKSDSTGYEPTMFEIIFFNKDGNVTQEYIRVLGAYGSETAYNYVYKNGVLDSINSLASQSKFNSYQKLFYDTRGKLNKIVSTGTFAVYVDTFMYDNAGKLSVIKRKHKIGVTTETRFDHLHNIVHEKITNAKGKVLDKYFVYDGDQLFAHFTDTTNPTIVFNDNYRRIEFEMKVKGDALNFIKEKRKASQGNTKVMGQLLEDYKCVIVFDIPAESKNEVGDLIRRLQLDKRFFSTVRRLVFSEITYADGKKSGSTDFDMIFNHRVKDIN